MKPIEPRYLFEGKILNSTLAWVLYPTRHQHILLRMPLGTTQRIKDAMTDNVIIQIAGDDHRTRQELQSIKREIGWNLRLKR